MKIQRGRSKIKREIIPEVTFIRYPVVCLVNIQIFRETLHALSILPLNVDEDWALRTFSSYLMWFDSKAAEVVVSLLRRVVALAKVVSEAASQLPSYVSKCDS